MGTGILNDRRYALYWRSRLTPDEKLQQEAIASKILKCPEIAGLPWNPDGNTESSALIATLRPKIDSNHLRESVTPIAIRDLLRQEDPGLKAVWHGHEQDHKDQRETCTAGHKIEIAQVHAMESMWPYCQVSVRTRSE